jgi:outer membrane protein assembly factor BamB
MRLSTRFVVLVGLLCQLSVNLVWGGSQNAGWRVPIVDFGDDYAWYGGLPQYRQTADSRGLVIERAMDLDNDGKKDDGMAYHPLSLTQPLNPQGAFYNNQGNNARFYGGLVSWFLNMNPRWSEGGINIDHEMRDDFNLHSYATEGKGEAVKTIGLWVWLKEDFLNSASSKQQHIRIDNDCIMSVYVSRYWRDYEQARFVIRQGDQFYISEYTFGGKPHTLYSLKPNDSRWATYSPKEPTDITFDPKAANFQTMSFTDVTAVGWYVAHPTFKPAALWLKWNAFSCEGVIDNPDEPSLHLAMNRTDDGLCYTRDLLPYGTWRQVYRHVVRNQYALWPGYRFDRDGDMGAMDRLRGAASAKDAVTDITLLDAITWCNALSELEGLRPVYYQDAEHKQVLRHARVRNLTDDSKTAPRPDVHADWSATGYRLPTLAEAHRLPSLENKGVSDHVWVWPVQDDHLAGEEDQRLVYGRQSPKNLPPSISIRIVRRTDGKSPDMTIDQNLGWQCTVNDPRLLLPEPKEPVDITLVHLPEMTFVRNDGARVSTKPFYAGSTEVTFAQWTHVLAWAQRHAYRIDRDGDMGSMDWANPDDTCQHDPNEPVTDIGYFDAMAWCNALSQMHGLTPVYYTDSDKTNVYRQSLSFRARMCDRKFNPYGTKVIVTHQVYMKWEADGFRLPTEAQWEQLARASSESQTYPWGESFDTNHAWIADNSEAHTHPVGQKQPNKLGIYDAIGNVFEWCWGGNFDYYDNADPRGDGTPAVRGGSFRVSTGKVETDILYVGTKQKVGWNLKWGTSWPEIGFRVIRTDAGVHSPKPPANVPQVVLKLDADRPDPTDVGMYRGHMARTGCYDNGHLELPLKTVWKISLNGPVAGPPAIAEGRLYVGDSSGQLVCLNADDGKEHWRVKLKGPLRGSPMAVGQQVFAVAGNQLFALKADSGQTSWTVPNLSPSRNHGLTIAGNVVFANLNWSTLAGFDTATGKEVWRHRDNKGLGQGDCVPAVFGTRIVWCDGSPHIVAADLTTERLLWRFNADADQWEQTPAIRNGKVFFAGGQGLLAVDLESGKELWRFKQSQWSNRHPRFSSPAVDQDTMYIGQIKATVWAVNTADGTFKWKCEIGSPPMAAPIVIGNHVVVLTDRGVVYVLEKQSGQVAGTIDLQSGSRNSLVYADGRIYVTTGNGAIVCLSGPPASH